MNPRWKLREARWMTRRLGRGVRNGPAQAAAHAQAWRRFWKAYSEYQRLAPSELRAEIHNLYPCLGEDTAETPVEPIYYYQDAWAFEKIVSRQPSSHVDVGSHHKFVALLSKVVSVTMVDVRPLPLALDTLAFVEASILELPFEDGSVPSVSSLCVVEHVGLGRYGDPLDPFGTEKAVDELKRVVTAGGDLYVSLPLDVQTTVYFNAHRAYAEHEALRLFDPFEVIERRYIYDDEFCEEPRRRFGVGCYHLRKSA